MRLSWAAGPFGATSNRGIGRGRSGSAGGTFVPFPLQRAMYAVAVAFAVILFAVASACVRLGAAVAGRRR